LSKQKEFQIAGENVKYISLAI